MLTASLFHPRSISKTWKHRIVFQQSIQFLKTLDVELVKKDKKRRPPRAMFTYN